ncbi:ATP-binding protein [uncultured Pseudodesulfovibrio sp.]|uniref:AlbA family DNA-binding domain-containing protein n=1 Tax=uncultured Pseudodesulfovibrio sp. TaxID=2035858 RepID=UPI0029C6981C|nr:ATP-binding protein [uncultured Pseudodesulfovibrio sp.]
MKIDHNFIEILLLEEEGTSLDFKSKQYPFKKATDDDKSELLKDILAFSNSWRRGIAHIVVGVKEIPGERSEVVGHEECLDDANIQQFVNSKTNRPIDFSCLNIQYEDKKISVIAINLQERPFYLKKDYGKLKAETVYIRRGSATTIANLDEIAKMNSMTFNPVVAQAPQLHFAMFNQQNQQVTSIEVNGLERLDKGDVIRRLNNMVMSEEDRSCLLRNRERVENKFNISDLREEIAEYHEKINTNLSLAESDFEQLCRHHALLTRSLSISDYYYRKFPPDIPINQRYFVFKLVNSGTGPAKNVH